MDPIKRAELKPHQIKALEKMGNGRILNGGVGTGKSRTAVVYYMLNEAPKDLYIITTAKKRDSLEWQDETVIFGIGSEKDATTQGVLTVDSWNMIKKYVDVENAFFIFDEQRLVGTGAWVKAFYKIAAKNNWILLTGTPGDTWLDYVPVFIANGFYKNITEFKREHVVYDSYSRYPKVKQYLGTGRLNRLRRHLLVDMPLERLTVRHSETVRTEYNQEQMRTLTKDRWHIWEDRPIKDAAELFRLMRYLVNTDESKIEELASLWDKHPRLIVFYNFNYELNMLRSWLDGCEDDVAEWNGHRHEPLPTSKRWLYLVQYTAGAEGWNCITTDAMVMLSQNYSYRLTEQAMGRIDRLNTPYRDLYYYTLRSYAGIDNAIHKALSQKKDFNESLAYSANWLKE